MRAFHFKSETSIQRDSPFIIGVNIELNTQISGPIVRPFEQSSHHFRTDTLLLSFARYTNAKSSDMPATHPRADAVNPAACYDFSIFNRQQVETVVLISLLLEMLAPSFNTRIRRLQ